ncbi:hypothetical protein Avbf_16773 [Armadillidium vulgare]|nr:hypothetical protein Avbf_16773 [Armadillidium vulgare]
MYLSAVMWFEQAYNLAGLEMNETIRQDQVLQFLDKAYQEIANSDEQNNSPVLISSKISQINDGKNKVSRKKTKLGDDLTAEEVFSNYEALCRGEQLLK